jgi:hypothetical protein
MPYSQRLSRLLPLAVVLASTVVPASVSAKGTRATRPPDASFQPMVVTAGQISSAGPLTKIFAATDASTQVAHILEQGSTNPYEFYPAHSTFGDAGTFLAVAGVLYAPRFLEHDDGTATASLGAFTGYTSVSQSAVSGAGTPADPFKITTVVSAPGTGLTITQRDSYVVGQESYRTDVTISNSSGATRTGIVYRGIDCYLGGSDHGYGFVTGTAPACTTTANNTPPERFIQLQPITAGNNYFQSDFYTVWATIGTQAALPNTCACTEFIDNGIAISWPFSIPNGGSSTYSHNTAILGRSSSRRIADFDGDGLTDLTVYHQPSGLWYSRSSSTTATTTVSYGGPGYTPVAADYDGDDQTDVAVFHDASGMWFIRQSSDLETFSIGFGGPGYIPVPRDYDADGEADIALYHPPSGLWFIRQSASDDQTLTAGYGGPGYAPTPNDYDGDGRVDLAVYHEASGIWYIRRSASGNTTLSVGFGGSGYVPVPRDYDGDGKADVAVYHPPSGMWFVKRSLDGATQTVSYGGTAYAPVPADYDGDNKVDIAVYHESTGVWSISKSSTGSTVQFTFGGPGLKAVNLPPVYTTP